MKKLMGFFIVLISVSPTIVFSQTADRAFSAVIREAQSYVNGCGSDGAPQWAISGLNWLSGRGGTVACNQHDKDYGTLGVSRSEADNNLFSALKLNSWTSVPAVAGVFWTGVRNYGESSYNSAQRHSREEFKRIHHGNEWSSRYGRWHPSDGHIRMSFPQCVSSCNNLSR
jgi:hypothetical protein